MSFPPGTLRGPAALPLTDVQVYIPRPGFYVPTAGTYGWDEFSYDIPSWARVLYVRCVGSGGGGGSGSVEPAATAAWGGGGGGSGSIGETWLPTILMPSRLWIFAPWGGVGGAAVATTGTSGNNGGPGLGAYVCVEYPGSALTDSLLQTHSLVSGYGGGNGKGGTTSAAGAGTAGAQTVWVGTAGGNSAAGAGVGAPVGGIMTAGGGGGGGMASTHAETAGGGGGIPYVFGGQYRTVPQGGAVHSNGQDGWLSYNNQTTTSGALLAAFRDFRANIGGGGAGGGSSLTTTVNAGNGGHGALGCGGGGGGSKENDTTYTSGKGGNGGPGMVLIVALG